MAGTIPTLSAGVSLGNGVAMDGNFTPVGAEALFGKDELDEDDEMELDGEDIDED